MHRWDFKFSAKSLSFAECSLASWKCKSPEQKAHAELAALAVRHLNNNSGQKQDNLGSFWMTRVLGRQPADIFSDDGR